MTCGPCGTARLLSLLSLGLALLGSPFASARAKATSLLATVDQNLRSPLTESCDHDHADLARELATAIDRREAEIRKLGETRPVDKNYRLIRVGPTVFREPLRRRVPTRGWHLYSASWEKAREIYHSLKDTPTDERWLKWSMQVRSLVLRDRKRLVVKTNMGLDKDAGPKLEKAIAHFSGEETTLPSDTSRFLKANYLYRRYLKRIDRAADDDTRDRVRELLLERLKHDYERRFSFRPNPAIRAVGDVYEVPLDAGPFSAVKSDLARFIESVWTGPRKVRIRWSNAGDVPGVFRVLLDSIVGERAYVNRTTRELHLSPQVRVSTLAHEFGHVLGFPDRYYEVWSHGRCAYRTQKRPSDLMSVSAEGAVLAEDWKTLQKHYGGR